MGAILGKEWGGAYFGGKQILDINSEWKLKSGSTTVLPVWNMLYQITGKIGQCILWGKIAPRNGSDHSGQNLLDLSFLGNIDSFYVELHARSDWLSASNNGNILVCNQDLLSSYGSDQRGFSSFDDNPYLTGFSLK